MRCKRQTARSHNAVAKGSGNTVSLMGDHAAGGSVTVRYTEQDFQSTCEASGTNRNGQIKREAQDMTSPRCRCRCHRCHPRCHLRRHRPPPQPPRCHWIASPSASRQHGSHAHCAVHTMQRIIYMFASAITVYTQRLHRRGCANSLGQNCHM